jgi:hypothetical protein
MYVQVLFIFHILSALSLHTQVVVVNSTIQVVFGENASHEGIVPCRSVRIDRDELPISFIEKLEPLTDVRRDQIVF